MSELDLSAPSIDIDVPHLSLHSITIGLDFDGSGSEWAALVRRHPNRGEFVEWTIDDSGAGTPGTIELEDENGDTTTVAVEGTLVVSADSTVLVPGVWYWSLFRDGNTFFGLGKVTVEPVVREPDDD